MKRLFCKIFQGLFFLTLIWTFCGCNILSSQGMTRESDCTIISWNLQTFFDSVTDGTEYDEFKGSKSKWTKEKYQDRIDRLCDFMEEQDADIYVFVEVENIDILQDISNNLSTRSVRGGKYRYACFGKNEGGVFGCGVISKYPLENVKLHNIDFRNYENQPELRPILEVSAYTKNQSVFSLFVCHWKSKSGGEAESEIWRDLQESLLTSCILNADNKQVVACGDFNRELSEFKINEISNKVVLRSFNSSETNFLELTNPWLLSNEKGSYVYNEEWNKIDHFFLSENVSFMSFSTISDYTDEKGYPIKYSVRTGKGYSDHLPIMCQLSF